MGNPMDCDCMTEEIQMIYYDVMEEDDKKERKKRDVNGAGKCTLD